MKQISKRNKFILILLIVLVLGTGSVLLADTARATNLSKCRLRISERECTYTGKTIKPEVKITLGTKTLKEGEDYVYRYLNNKNPGKARIIIAGIHDYTGFLKPSFRISVDPVKELKAKYVGDEDVDKDAYIKLTWKPSSLCDHYQITAVKKSGKSSIKKTYNTRKTSFKFTELDGSGKYSFIVNAIGGPARSRSDNVKATAMVNPLPKPSIEVASPGAGHITVTWDEVPKAQQYVVTETSGGEQETVTVSGDETEAHFLRRDCETTYDYTVRAVATIEGQTYDGPESDSHSISPESARIGQAIGGDNGHTGNKTGDQKGGGEIATGKWSYSSKHHAWNNWTYVARFKDPEKAAKAAQAMRDACENDNIGYDQKPGDGRGELKNLAAAADWDMTAISQKCETSCSPLVGACVCCAGVDLPAPGSTGDSDLLRPLERTEEFEILRDSKYTKSKRYLQEGDILVSPGRHTGMVI